MLGFVYKIASPSTELVYFGSTTRPLDLRFNEHKYDVKRYNPSSKLITQYSDCYIELIEEINFQDKKELLEVERHYIENYPCVNISIPLLTSHESEKKWRDKHKEELKLKRQIRKLKK